MFATYKRMTLAPLVQPQGACLESRSGATPSNPPFHEAAKDELEIAAEIWDVARVSDRETPHD